MIGVAKSALLVIKKPLDTHVSSVFGAKPPCIGRAVQADAVIADGCAKSVLRRGDRVFGGALCVRGNWKRYERNDAYSALHVLENDLHWPAIALCGFRPHGLAKRFGAIYVRQYTGLDTRRI